jgi:hypothetical protein
LGTVESGATVTNLVVEGAAVGIQDDSMVHSTLTGCASLAYSNDGAISNCAASGWVATHVNAGGLVFRNTRSIRDCYFDGCVVTDGAASELDQYNCLAVGGLLAYNDGSISGCYATGVVFAERAAGGLVGQNRISITDCYSTTMVLTDSGGGGLVGINWGNLTRCYAIGWVTGQMRAGLVGMSDRSISGTIISSVWDIWKTDCLTSGGGTGVIGLGAASGVILADNGWAGDPNWVIVHDLGAWENYPHLTWEGINGEVIPEPVISWGYKNGSGTENDPYVIRSESSLGELCKTSIHWDKHFVLAADLDMASYRDFSPIGVCRGSAFSGTLDGNDHTIRNVTMDVKDATAWDLGVFGCVTGQIKRLTVENVRLVSGQNSRCVGLLAGTCEGRIENCRASGSLTVGEDSRYIGGLVGYFTSWSSLNREKALAMICEGTIENCWASGSVTVGEDSQYVGGLVGYVRRPATSGNVVINCGADAAIDAGEGSTFVGGLIGCENNRR